MANRNYANSRLYTGHIFPVSLDCSFTVAATDSGGLGITGLKGAYVQNVFMHTSSTAGAGNSNPQTPNKVITNPNPASGTILVQLQDVYTQLYCVDSFCSATTGTPVKIDNSAMTAGVAYTITTLGNASAAKWLAIGVPAGITPAVGVSFIALSDGGSTNTSTSRVAPAAAAGSGIFSIETLGQAHLILPSTIATNGFGSQIILQCRNDSAADAPAIAAPADGTIIKLRFLLSNSSVTVGGN